MRLKDICNGKITAWNVAEVIFLLTATYNTINAINNEGNIYINVGTAALSFCSAVGCHVADSLKKDDDDEDNDFDNFDYNDDNDNDGILAASPISP